MPTVTDPARELVDICLKLSTPAKERGDVYLAERFGVESWSTEFFQIIFVISSKADELIEIIGDLELDEDFKKDAIHHVKQIKSAFSPKGLNHEWSLSVANFMSPANVGPIKMLSPQVRAKYSYPKLDAAEIAEVKAEVEVLLGWLTDHQLKEQDFIRQAIIVGLRQFLFRLDRVGWLGWGFTLESLRDVIGAYLALERGMPDANVAPDAAAVLRKLSSGLKVVLDKIGIVKGAYETGEFLLKAYGAVMLLTQGPHAIAGLLTFTGG